MDLIDQDYLHKLTPKELEWLNKFNKEYIGDDLDRENLRKNLHRTKKLKKDCDDRNNARNRDILTREKASNRLMDYEELYEIPSNNNYEDHIIEQLDQKDIINAVEWLSNELGKDEEVLEERLISVLEDKVKP